MEDNILVNLDFVMGKSALKYRFDGVSDDLLSGGSGFDGLKKGKAPAFKNPENPTPAEIRKRTLWNNYRGLIDMSDDYYGKLYGPGVNTDSPELIAGEEYLAVIEGNVSVVLQIPESFNASKPYLIAAPSSGSRGVYGAIGVVGEWALKKGYAVVYTDKGTGIGYHDLDTDRVGMINGTIHTAESAGDRSVFTAISRDNDTRKTVISEYKKKYPHRIAVKHAHSGVNPQKDWGKFVLQSIEFAIDILKQKFNSQAGLHGTDDVITREKLTIIAGGISNGGGASLMAAAEDGQNLIDAIVVSEPNVTPEFRSDFSIVQGNQPPFKEHSKSLVDYMSLLNIYQPCASLAVSLEHAPFNFSKTLTREQCVARCLSLKEKGLLKGDSIEELAADACGIISSYGIIEEQNMLQPSHYNFDVTRSITFTYISQYGRFDVTDNPCGYSFAAVDQNGKPRAVTLAEQNHFYSDQNGIPPFGIVKLINNLDRNGPLEDRMSASSSSGKKDMNLDGALRLRSLVTGVDEQNIPLSGEMLENHKRVRQGLSEISVSTDTGTCPVIIVTGRADAVLQINHTSRAYAGAKFASGKNCEKFRYYEITNAHHIDVFNYSYANKKMCNSPHSFAPLQHYYLRSLEIMVNHVEKKTELPENQVVRPYRPTTDLPDIKNSPPVEDLILFKNKVLKIPD